MLSTIWDDIDNELEAIVISDIKYHPTSLSNNIYEILHDSTSRHKILKSNKIKGLYSNLQLIQDHRDIIHSDEKISKVIQLLFKTSDITSTDKLFINSYLRKLLRAKLELDFADKELVIGQIITGYSNELTDISIMKTLKLLRLICKFLGIKSTFESGTFSKDKLYMPSFWNSISCKFFELFGESKINVIDVDDPIELTTIDAVTLSAKQREIRETQVLMLLNNIFNIWCGSTLMIEHDMVKVVPALFVTRLLTKLSDVTYN